MAYDEELADLIRELLGPTPGVREQRMFGGLSFLVEGKMVIAASGQGGVLVRVDPADADRLVASSDAEVAVMGSRTMRGWLRIPPAHVRTKHQLEPWVRQGVDAARSRTGDAQERQG